MTVPAEYVVNIAAGGNEDWAKTTLDFPGIDTADKLRERLYELGWTVEAFKELPAYRLALASGKYPWLDEL